MRRWSEKRQAPPGDCVRQVGAVANGTSLTTATWNNGWQNIYLCAQDIRNFKTEKKNRFSQSDKKRLVGLREIVV
jgi:hypothetical protein